MKVKIITPAQFEPVSIAKAKLHLRANDTSEEDELIGQIISSARGDCEQQIDATISPATLELYIDKFPASGEINLARGPVTAINSIRYVDNQGVRQTLSSEMYKLLDDRYSSSIMLVYGQNWPSTRNQFDAVTIQYQAGFLNCPPEILAWILLRIGTLYRYREADAERVPMPSPFSDRLLDGYRRQAA